MTHIPVLLNEVLEYLDPKPGDLVLDATIGCGGHSQRIIEKILPGGKLIGIDQDEEILKELDLSGDVILVNGNFGDLKELLKNEGVEKIDKVLFDLGMNSLQIDESRKGFSFQKDEPLMMSYKTVVGPNDLVAKEILNMWSKEKIFKILKEYGEERFARNISENIFKGRKEKPFNTTFDLVAVIEKSVPNFYKRKKIHFATKTFQALRIAVNDEMEVLKEGLEGAWEMLSENGRIVVISFHSLEDRIVKNFFKNKARNDEGELLTKKPIGPTDQEFADNPRARSAKLRAIEKI
ncbi:MAG: 16S rRNA (cytosine(1402)-N(4))-methyltransferase RsmH [Patescibacteria group bacterium]